MTAIEAEDRATVRADRPRPRLVLAQRLKPQRDRAVVRALLRMLGVAFAEAEVIAPVDAPIDVRLDWMSCSLSMGPMACWPRPRPRQRSVRWPCKAGGRCRWCVRPTGWCCMPRAVRLTFFARSQGGCYGNGRTSTPCSKGASIDQPLTPGLAAIVAWPPSSGTAGRETLKTLGAPSQTNCGPIEGVILDGGSM